MEGRARQASRISRDGAKAARAGARKQNAASHPLPTHTCYKNKCELSVRQCLVKICKVLLRRQTSHFYNTDIFDKKVVCNWHYFRKIFCIFNMQDGRTRRPLWN